MHSTSFSQCSITEFFVMADVRDKFLLLITTQRGTIYFFLVVVVYSAKVGVATY